MRYTDMSTPDCLFIGGMKCGSTSVYEELRRHPRLFEAEKELNLLAESSWSAQQIRQSYEHHYRQARGCQLLCDSSTTYSKLPEIQGVAERAKRVCGDSVKIVYVVREPVSRTISHHYHMYSHHGEGRMGPDINACIATHPNLINFSRYAYQLEPWRDEFGDDAIHVVQLESLIADRAATLSRLWDFLGVDRLADDRGPAIRVNRSDGKRVLNQFWAPISESPAYRLLVRPAILRQLRQQIAGRILPAAPPRPAPPTLETVDEIIDRVAADEQQLRSMMKCTDPLWDFEDVRNQFRDVPPLRRAA